MSDDSTGDDVTQLRAEIDDLRAQLANLTAHSSGGRRETEPNGDGASAPEQRTDRRGLLKVAGAATVGAVGAGLLSAAPSAATSPNFFGLYRGTCVNNEDPEELGRILASVPSVFGTSTSGWALPSFPVGSTLVPAVNEKVWIAFEHGDTHYPVWIGVWGQIAVVGPS
jgi:hypothetical protein